MTWAVVSWAQKQKVGSPSGKALLMALANFADEDGGKCFPGQEAIREITELSLDTIQRQLKYLVDRGFVIAEKRRRKGHWASWTYKINVSNQAAPCGMVDKNHQAASCGPAKPHYAAQPDRTMRPYPLNKPIKEPSRMRGPSRPDGLGPAGAILRRKLGDNVFDAWFSGVTIKSETAVLITLAAPTKFKASRIRQNFDIQTLAAWREILPSIERIDVEIAA
jgi:hypothetical protein